MKTAELLDLIEQWGVMPPMQVANLRKQVAAAEYPVHPVLMARRLVEEGYINAYFAKTLLAGGPLSGAAEPDAPVNPAVKSAAAKPDDDYRLAMRPGASPAENAVAEETPPELHFDDLKLPPIQGSDWLTRSADTETVGSLPSLAATTLGDDGAKRPLAAQWKQRWEKLGLAGLPWWVIGLAAVGVLTIVITLLVVIF